MRTTNRGTGLGWRASGALSIVVLLASGCAAATPAGTPAGIATHATVAQASQAVSTPTPTPTPTPAATPDPTRDATPTTMEPPPPPSSARMRTGEGALGEYDIPARRFKVSWSETYPKGTEIRVYGVTECLNNVDGEPCLPLHTPLPASVRHLVARAPAADGKVIWTWPGWENIGGSLAASREGDKDYYYEAFVVAAYNDAGHSKFIILESTIACPECTY
jgi:hypothetical protein